MERNVAEEKRSYDRVVAAFCSYESMIISEIDKYIDDIVLLPDHQISRIGGRQHFEERRSIMKNMIESNSNFISLFSMPYDQVFGESEEQQPLGSDETLGPTPKNRVKFSDFNNVKSALRQFAREWSREGKRERDCCYGPILQELTQRFPIDQEDTQKKARRKIKVLTPGSGMGRLTWEIAKEGFFSQGNECSFYMLLPSNFILNCVERSNQFVIFPYVHSTKNMISFSHASRAVKIPDVLPSDLPQESNFSMNAGDFLEAYSTADDWDCIVTCFFIDTAHNIVDYIDKIFHILKPGGIWINLGPLLYHWSDSAEQSVELSMEEVVKVINSFGFAIEKEGRVQTSYSGNCLSMMQIVYNCVYFVATKPFLELINQDQDEKDDNGAEK